MLTQRNIELKSLLTNSLREKQGSYLIEELMNSFPFHHRPYRGY